MSFAALDHYRLIRASGAEAQAFLQAQLTADLRELTPRRSTLAAWCNAKGRVQAIFRVFMRDGDIFLRLPAALLPLTLPRLKMFVLRAKVTLSDLSADWAALGVLDARAAAALGPLPAINQAQQAGELTILAAPGAGPRYEVWGPRAAMAAAGGKLRQTGSPPASSASWRLLDLRSGLPELHPETREAFTPHMLNLDLLGAVSFRKGCYPGQEVVAKTQHRGLAKRRLFLANHEGAPVPPATRVLTADGQHAGDVVEALQVSEGKCELSAVLMLEHAGQAGLRLDGSQIPLTVSSPPYPLE